MKKFFLVILCLAVVSSVFIFAGGGKEKTVDEASIAWLKEAKLGKYVENSFDEKALYEAAKLEGSVNIYSYSSRVFKFGETFEKKYPGIKVNGFDMDSGEIVTKISAEQTAQNFVADVIFLKDVAVAYNVLVDKGLAHNYVPADLKKVVPKEYQEPMFVHHTSIQGFVYNTEKNKKEPFNSLWDLTKPEWKGKVVLPDPQKLSEFIEIYSGIVENADSLAKEYEKVFKEKIKLSAGIKNAGYEWLYRVLKNDAIIVGSTNDVSKAVGLSQQDVPPVGLTAYSRIRDMEKDPNLKFAFTENTTPVSGFSLNVVQLIVNRAPHPNAAKLLIHYMLGDEKGGEGYEPYYVAGNFSVRTDVPPIKGLKPITEMKVWSASPEFVWYEGQQVLDFWTSNLK
ncbi:MAG: ABC transporter substrate-binding protein [Spirochaetia bacterium]|nr:ABC transporter substrate-binding protein [Spirochaetia bacterium]